MGKLRTQNARFRYHSSSVYEIYSASPTFWLSLERHERRPGAIFCFSSAPHLGDAVELGIQHILADGGVASAGVNEDAKCVMFVPLCS